MGVYNSLAEKKDSGTLLTHLNCMRWAISAFAATAFTFYAAIIAMLSSKQKKKKKTRHAVKQGKLCGARLSLTQAGQGR